MLEIWSEVIATTLNLCIAFLHSSSNQGLICLCRAKFFGMHFLDISLCKIFYSAFFLSGVADTVCNFPQFLLFILYLGDFLFQNLALPLLQAKITNAQVVYSPGVVQEDLKIAGLDQLLIRCLKMDQNEFKISCQIGIGCYCQWSFQIFWPLFVLYYPI